MKSFWVAILFGNSSVISVVCILAILSVWKRESFRVVHLIGLMEGLTSTPPFNSLEAMPNAVL